MRKLFLFLFFLAPSSVFAVSYDSGGYGQTVSTVGVAAAGTVYSLTTSTVTLDFGTTDPTITLSKPGTYILFPSVNLKYNAATFLIPRNVLLKLRRTNNTAADLNGASLNFVTDVITALTYTAGTIFLPVVIYTTGNSNDAIALQGAIGVAPSAGTVDVTAANILAVKISQ